MFRNKYDDDLLNKVIIKRTDRKKTISISIKADKIILLSPRFVSTSFLYDILIKKKKWIIKKLKQQSESFETNYKKFIVNKTLLKFGKKKNISFKKSISEKVVEKGDIVEIYYVSKNDIENIIKKWLREELEFYINQRLNYYKKLMKVKYNSFNIKSYKSKLGSCSYNGRLSFNLKIITMPRKVIDYILIHELCHLKHFNHSKDFWYSVEKYCPDFNNQKNWIKKHQNSFL